MKFSRVLRQRDSLFHGGGKVCLVSSQMAVMFGHLGRTVPHQFSEGFNVYTIDYCHCAELVADAIHGDIAGNFGFHAKTPQPEPQHVPSPRSTLGTQEYVRIGEGLLPLDAFEEPYHFGHHLDDPWARCSQQLTRLVLREDDHIVFKIYGVPGE